MAVDHGTSIAVSLSTDRGGRGTNWHEIEGSWKQVIGSAKDRWGRLTDNDLAIVRGRREQPVGAIREAYSIVSEDAEKQFEDQRAGLAR
jgi:uncharacterized protein YjbJ (UPF0337 family)